MHLPSSKHLSGRLLLRYLSYLLALLVVLLDSLLKVHADSYEINMGVAFGAWSGGGWLWSLAYLGLLLATVYIWTLHSSFEGKHAMLIMLILGVSNFYDRIAYGGVIDYIYWEDLAFNISDVGINLFLLSIIVYVSLASRRKR